MDIKDGSSVTTGDFWYDFFEGGYIKPKELLESQEDIDKVTAARETIEAFKSALEAADAIELM
jgi:hypothetical protein